MKISMLQTIAVAIVSSVFASSACASSESFKQGLYGGGAIGAGWGQASWDGITDIYAVNDQGSPLSYAASWVPNGDTVETEFAGRVMLGYQFVSKPLYLGFEVGGTFSEDYQFDRHEAKDFNNIYFLSTIYATADANNKVTLGGAEFNVDMKPGWLITKNILTYARVGLALNNIDIDSHASWTTINTDPLGGYPAPYTLSAHGSSHESNTAYGIRLGLGAEFLVTEHLGLTVDYIYSYYGTVTTASANDASTALVGPPQYYDIGGTDAPVVTVSTQTAMLGLLYHW
jgi:opacity protein-like surface antigen